MMQTIIGMCESRFKAKLNRQKMVVVMTLLLILATHTIILILRTDENQGLLLGLSILTDALLGWYLVAYVNLTVLPARRLYALYQRPAMCVEGKICEVTDELRRAGHFDCYCVVLEDRTLFAVNLPHIHFHPGDRVRLWTVSNTIVKVEWL